MVSNAISNTHHYSPNTHHKLCQPAPSAAFLAPKSIFKSINKILSAHFLKIKKQKQKQKTHLRIRALLIAYPVTFPKGVFAFVF